MAEHMTLEERKKAFDDCMAQYKARIIICAGTGCMANGSLDVYDRFVEYIEKKGLSIAVTLRKEKADYIISQSGCQGFCQMGPLVTLYPQGILYTKVTPGDVEEIIDETLLKGRPITRLLYHSPVTDAPATDIAHIPFYSKQNRTVLKLCGYIDAQDIDEYIANDGYAMAKKVFLEMTDEDVCSEMLRAGLRGRGGAGFPTGRKWDLTRIQKADVKYIVCNGDEGDPGAFMDRCVMEGNPHSVLEGMLIAAKAVGATEGYIYVRTEYPLAVERLKIAIADARRAGVLGGNIFGSGKSFDIHVMEGAGAFVCGEETALLASIEGKRGMPTPKPPFPAESGLFGKPTVINNVETLASVPIVMKLGADAYAAIGTEKSKGTKTFALTGHVANTGLIEVPFGATLRQIVGEIGGGAVNDDGTICGVDFKAVQIGGPSGGCLTKEHLDMPLDYENLAAVGAMVGSGGLVVMNNQTCIVQIARFFMQFTQNESCGKCVPCREGTKQMLALLDDIIEGRATAETLELLEQLAQTVKVGSLCGLGKTAPNPVLSTLRYFRDEYNAHVFEKRCPADRCEAFKKYSIAPDKCKSCGACARKCPMGAITGEKAVPYVIDKDKCIKCGACVETCKFGAISIQ
ncbi:NADH-quinone oxidoreductase subunit F [Sporobacter termitidis DSM 10068]|uniref:NADH-quinone oxidoreductase subunit F n=1 Tax=Sporobacter termitidis DSM 10068 TaxID=1123282 RepID=A0A1M5XS66_9FIRM|nr:NADH-ubiquinone oxidoreductase-F iron-sulfur binding region domain-containing protein [Sporobacter termitidis]SHI02630.1 NADH-quinone oxidoreductase subunit F [Sporobacter termitidis DSM 10068]